MSTEHANSNGEIDSATPHGRAQEQFNDAVFLAGIQGRSVTLTVGENGEASYSLKPEDKPSLAPEGVIFDPPKKPVKPRTHDTRGLNGFYKGTFFKDGIPQPRKRK